VGARRVIEQDRFSLPDFRFLYGYPNIEELENRRLNSIAGLRARADRILVGVEGGFVELTTASGNWINREDITAHWIMHVEDSTLPYAYIRAIATLDDIYCSAEPSTEGTRRCRHSRRRTPSCINYARR
jgi:hypothetical protein